MGQRTGDSRRIGTAVVAVGLALTSLVACSKDGGGGGGGGGAAGDNTLSVEMFDFGYNVVGTVTAGPVTITTANTGREWHMATFVKLQPGKTVADVATFLDAQQAGNEPGSIDTVVEKGLGAPGHILQPGVRQTLTVEGLDVGSYAMICYLPVEGQGSFHFSKGMVSGFEVGPAATTAATPKADIDLSLADAAEPAGLPTELAAGMHTFKLTSDGASGKDFTISQLGTGETLGSFGVYFTAEFNKPGGPDPGMADRAPGRILGSTYQIDAGRTVWLTVDIPPGVTYFDSATNVPGGNAVHKVASLKVT